MAKSITDNLKQLLVHEGLEPNQRRAMNWLQQTIEEMYGDKEISPEKMLKGKLEANNKYAGKMYMFRYVPTTKDVLPYYDEFPLIFVLKRMRTSMLAMNLHYLPPKWRITFLHRMDKLRSNDRLDETTRLRINYEIIKATSRLNIGLPIVKKYKNKGIKSKVVMIPADEWAISALLPTESFFKASKTTVWNDTRRKGLV